MLAAGARQRTTDAFSLRSAFHRARKLERSYADHLKRIARHVGDIVRGFPDGTMASAERIRVHMDRYATILTPWAEAVADRMVKEVAQHDDRSWRRASERLGRALVREVEAAPTGIVTRAALARQVGLITSLPTEAAERVHALTLQGMTQGRRTEEVVADILRTGEVTRSRAELIATTEVSRTATEFTKARAEHAGGTHYRWLTVGDGSVRQDHKVLAGRIFAWAEPPVADRRTGERAHPGCIFRCRCFCEPIF